MAEERITEVETPTGNTHTHTTVINDEPRGGGATWIIVLLIVVLAALAIWFFSGMRGTEMNKDNAVAAAANDVGDAAQQAGNAVEDAAKKVN
jgi:uncharacterized protein HemX